MNSEDASELTGREIISEVTALLWPLIKRDSNLPIPLDGCDSCVTLQFFLAATLLMNAMELLSVSGDTVAGVTLHTQEGHDVALKLEKWADVISLLRTHFGHDGKSHRERIHPVARQ